MSDYDKNLTAQQLESNFILTLSLNFSRLLMI